MRLYLSTNRRQYLADFRADGFPGQRDVALGTLDPAKAATLAARKLADLLTRAAPAAATTAQLSLVTTPGAAPLSRALADFCERKRHRTEATQGMHRGHARHILAALSTLARDKAVEAVPVADPDLHTAQWYRIGEALIRHWETAGRVRLRADDVEARRRFSPMASDTINKRLSTLSGALRYAWSRGVLREPPRLPERLPSQTVPRERWLAPEEIVALVAQVMSHGAHQHTPQMRAGRAARVWLRAWLGLSNADARALKVSAFNLVRGVWYRPRRQKTAARTAGAQGVELPMPLPMQAHLREWLEVSRLPAHAPVLYPWPNERRGLLMYASAAGMPPVTPHDFRRTAAHLLRLCGYDRDFARRWLGLSANSDMLARVYLQDDPLAVADVRMVAALGARLRLLPGGLSAVPDAPNLLGTSSEARNPTQPGDAEKRKQMEKIDVLVGPAGFEPATYGLKVPKQRAGIADDSGAQTPVTSSVPPSGADDGGES